MNSCLTTDYFLFLCVPKDSFQDKLSHPLHRGQGDSDQSIVEDRSDVCFPSENLYLQLSVFELHFILQASTMHLLF